VSLGELRSAVPLIRALLARDETIVTTHFTPAGRREAEKVFAPEIAAGRVHTVWVPFEFTWCFRRFFAAFQPKCGLVMEIEIWPRMIVAARAASVPLFPCNAQYPAKSFARDRDRSRWRFDLMAGFAGAFVKSGLQRDRFAAAGTPNIHVTGELRFDQPIPAAQVEAGETVRAQIARRTITITSVVKGEDAVYIPLISALKGPDAPLFIYVPRAPERFDETCQMLTDAGLRVARRSAILSPDLALNGDADVDVILGDSMGEMYFYLALCDLALIGGSFVEKGAHNISEPLALHKPVVTGPHTWTIEFPMVEAQAAGVAHQVATPAELESYIRSGTLPGPDAIAAFLTEQTGAVGKTLAALDAELNQS
jgi:3-deoxy-D-manno-octulosonic-acid transferase